MRVTISRTAVAGSFARDWDMLACVGSCCDRIMRNGTRQHKARSLTRRAVSDPSSVPPSRGRRRRPRSGMSAEGGAHFLVCRKPAGCLLRPGKPAVHRDLEDPAPRSAQDHLRRRVGLQDRFPRRTGLRLIVSLSAVFDLDLHRTTLPVLNRAGHRSALTRVAASRMLPRQRVHASAQATRRGMMRLPRRARAIA